MTKKPRSKKKTKPKPSTRRSLTQNAQRQSSSPRDIRGRGDAVTKRVYEVEVVKELKRIRNKWNKWSSSKSEGIQILLARNSINELIEKLEGQAGE